MTAEQGAQGGLFTGERLHAADPLFQADLARHLVAYRYGQRLAAGKRVLDAGCGDGYGTALLAEVARQAVGIDRAVDVITVARQRYQRPNLRYEALELENLAALGTPFDVVCHFQVIEHLVNPKPFLRAVREILEPRGVLVITTPNRLLSRVENPYHVHEYVGEELRSLLLQVFPRVELEGVWGNEAVMAFEEERAKRAQRILRLDPFGLRHWLPRTAVEWAYPRLARWVRRGVSAVGKAGIGEKDFAIRPGTDGALDLLARCYLQ